MMREEIVRLEEMNFNAWPALRTAHCDGWVLRSTGGDSRRVNSVNPMTPGVLALPEKIAAAEAIYRRWGREAIFRLTPLAEDGLDQMLAGLGYTVHVPTFVQVAEIGGAPADPGVRITDTPEAWIGAAVDIRGLSGEAAEVFALQHRAVAVDAGWALLTEDGRPAAVGVTAIERGWAGLLGIYVAKFARRRGLARRVSQGLLAHAHARGASRAWLQVEQANAAALPLYAALGFRTAYAYHHRVRGDRA
jgi:ribosomal protein S18 acetylase RimI-like enzyme